MAEISFELTNNALEVVQGVALEANFEECRTALTEMMLPYKNLIVTEDGIASAKNDRARIRKVSARIDEVRKNVKRAYTEPLTAFEQKCKQLTAICDEASSNIDGQVKAYEESKKGEKEALLKAKFEATAHDLIERGFLKWENVFDKKWLNATCSEDKAIAEMNSKIAAARDDIKAIESLNSEFEISLFEYYAETHNIALTLKRNFELMSRKERLEEERRRREEMLNAERELQKAKEQPRVEAPAPVEEKSRVFIDEIEQEQEKLYALDFRVWATERQLNELKAFLTERGIRFGRAGG